MSKTSLKSLYTFQWVATLFMFFTSISVLICVITQWEQFVKAEDDIMGYTVVVIVLIGLSAILISSLKGMIPLLKDYKYLKNNSYISIMGTVIGFTKNVNPETGTQSNTKPLIKIVPSNEEIVLHFNEYLNVGETYKFIYLPNTKIAEVIEKVE